MYFFSSLGIIMYNSHGQEGLGGVYATLRIIAGVNTGAIIQMTQPSLTLGRKPGPGVDYSLPGAAYMSSVHCTILYENGIFTITDHQSSNGTYVDNSELPAHRPYALLDGAIIQLGRTKANSVILEFKRVYTAQPSPAHQYLPPTQNLDPTQRRDFLPAPFGQRGEGNDPYAELTDTKAHEQRKVKETLPSLPIQSTFIDYKPTAPPSAAKIGLADQTNFRYAVGGSIIGLALIMMVGFFLFSWIEVNRSKTAERINTRLGAESALFNITPESLGNADYKLTAIQIWLGNDNNAILEFNQSESGFGNVRLIDRVLIFLPLMAIILVILAGLYMQGRLQARLAFGLILILALVINAIPPLWQLFSTADWRQAVQDALQSNNAGLDTNTLDTLTDATVIGLNSGYSYMEQVILGGLILVMSLVGLLTSLIGRKAR
jgi:pSer/pThr/pTyr-binding forkhead associated (FHA) protein